MITFFAIVAFLVFQITQCVLFFYLSMDMKRQRKVLNTGTLSFH